MKKHIEPRRYLVNFNTTVLAHRFTDVLVIGAGAGGLMSAIEAGNQTEVLILAKDRLSECNTFHAQGGVAVVLSPEDSFDSHIKDTLEAGQGLCEPEVVNTVVEKGPEVVHQIIGWGAKFDREGDLLASSFEGGHSFRRIIHAHGDATGAEIHRTLLARASELPKIRMLENVFVIDLITVGGRCCGALIERARGTHEVIWAKVTVLATGGAGQLYRETTNPAGATGDGLALAYRAGAELRDLEFVQFHPTTLYVAGASRALISEAVRGEGGLLRNSAGEAFMKRYHPRGDLAPRDIVALSILREMKATGATNVYLDVTHLPGELVRTRFPNITRLCTLFDLDITREWIPVRPSAHYMVGGVTVDLRARTAVPGLLACGEVTSTGLHGANRLASNSLLESLVFGKIAGQEALEILREFADERIGPYAVRHRVASPSVGYLDLTDVRNSLRSIMWRDVGIERSRTSLENAISMIDFWRRYTMDKEFSDPTGWEIQNMLTISKAIAKLALERQESRGCHFRTDFPDRDDHRWAKHTSIRREVD